MDFSWYDSMDFSWYDSMDFSWYDSMDFSCYDSKSVQASLSLAVPLVDLCGKSCSGICKDGAFMTSA